MLLLDGPANGASEGDNALGRVGDAVESGHHRIGVGDKLVASCGPHTAELHWRAVNTLTRGDQNTGNVFS